MSVTSVGVFGGVAEGLMSCLGVEVSEADYTVPWRLAGTLSDGNPAPPREHANRHQRSGGCQMHDQVHQVTSHRVAEAQQDLRQCCNAQARDGKAACRVERAG